MATLADTPSRAAPLDIRHCLLALERDAPAEIVHVTQPVDPARFEVTAVLQRLEDLGRYPTVVFDQPLGLDGEPAEMALVSNLYATRERCARALGLTPAQAGVELSLEYARREARRIAPVVVEPAEAPVKQIVEVGEAADLRRLPIVRHHRMDGGPYIDMTPIMRDPDSGAYNIAFQRTQYKGPRKLGLHMSPRHNWQIARAYEATGQPTPVAIVVGHHPAFFIGALNVSPFQADDYEVVSSIVDRPLRLVRSETWGDAFMVPADAEIVIEGSIPPGVREVEGPFGEFPGTYGPQRVRWVIEVHAITRRRDAVYQDVFVGHRDVSVLGSFPKEGSLFNRIRAVAPNVHAVHLPTSGVGRFHCYISLADPLEGQARQAALVALGNVDFIKHVVVVDADIDVYREEQVLWAIATRLQADEDVDVIRNARGSMLDPSAREDGVGAKMILDATKPPNRPFEERIEVPREVVARTHLDRLIPPDQLARLGL